MAAAWVAELTGPDDVAAITGRVRATLGTISRPLAFAALWAVEQALPEYRSSALAWLGRTEEVEAEARRACQTEQGRRWYRHHPNGADADAAAMKAAEAARKRTAEYLLAMRLEPLRGQAAELCCEESAATTTATRCSASDHMGGFLGRDGNVRCGRQALPSREVCARHRAQELAGEVAEPDSPGTVRAGRLVV
ncbi:hypothetical protein AB0B21_33015 [Streptomyces rimosus]|uniref:hypothetical protein n=1 Tax=Streptomyces rimosus TaxID=1927 RepID=UPI0033DFCD66